MSQITYRFRHHAFVREVAWTLADDALIVESDGGKRQFPLRLATELRLGYDPTRVALNRYRCDVYFRGSGHAALLNLSYAGFAEFEDRSAAYLPFVRALVAATARANPQCRFRAGKRPFAYWFSLVFVSVMLLVLLYVLWLTAGLPLHWIVPVKIGLILAMLPVAIVYVRKNRPRPFDPAAIPEELLPSAELAP